MAKPNKKELAKWEQSRDLNAELLAVMPDIETGYWVRKTVFTEQPDGTMRRQIVRHDGFIEKDELIAAEQWTAMAARAGTKLSQAEFAKLIGVSKRTLQEWEQGRKRPSGGARPKPCWKSLAGTQR